MEIKKMSKKFTSFMVLLAMMLLTLPSHAQVQKQKLVAGKEAKAMRTMQQALKVNPAELALAKDKAMKAAAQAAEGESFAQWDWAAHAPKQFVPQSGVGQLKQMALASAGKQRGTLVAQREALPMNAFDGQTTTSRYAATTDSHGIITAPDEGEHKYYTRSGMAYYASGNSVYAAAQSGVVETVETADGTIYIKDLVSRYTQSTWVKGTKSGNTITVEAGQPVAYNTQYSTTLSINKGVYTTKFAKVAGDITFTINGDVISLDGSDEDNYIGVFWDDDNAFVGYGDYETVWTLDENYTPPSTELVTLPEGVEVLDWYAEGSNYYSSAAHTVPENVKVAFDGNDVYVKGIFTNMPNAWIKGTINGTTATFPTLQYIGTYNGSMDMWLYVADTNSSALDAATFTYDAAAQTLTLDEDQMLFANAASDRIYYLEYIDALTLSAEKPVYELIELPEGAEVQTWYAEGLYDDDADVPYTVQVAFVGDDVYVSGIFSVSPISKAWIKGTLEGSTVTFPPLQYLGDYQTNHIWTYAASVDEEAGTYVPLDAVTFTYDVVEKTLTMDDNQVLAANAAKNRLYYLEYIKSLTLSGTPPPLPTAPYTADFTKQSAMRNFVILDNNGDNRTWSWSASNFAYYTYHTSNAADDYLILPIDLEAGKYSVTVNAASYSERYPEKFEVVVGKDATPEALNITAIEESTVASGTFTDYEGEFITDKAGTWYVAIHAISDRNEWYLKVKSLSIEIVPQETAPAAPTLTVEAGAEGALLATGTLTAPTTAINGETLKKNVDKIEVWCDDALLTTIYDMAPGSTKKILDEPQTEGLHTYYAVAYNKYGVGLKSEKTTIFIGVDKPADIENVLVTGQPTAGSISFAWDAVKALNGGYLDVANAQYSVTTVNIEEVDILPPYGWYVEVPVEGQTLGTVTGETTATVNFAGLDQGEIGIQYFGVKAKVGNGVTDPTSWLAYVYTGAPYKLPIQESFEGKSTHYLWDYNEVTGLGVSDDASDGDGVALALTAVEEGTVMFESFKLNTAAAANPTLVFDTKKGTSETDKLTVYGLAPNGTKTVLQTVTLTDEYQTVKVVIPAELAKERWAKVGFNADLEEGTNILLDNITVLDLYEYDLSAAVAASKSVVAGQTTTVTATVKNEGERDVTGYTITVKAGEEVLLEETVNEALKMFATKTFTAEYTPNIFTEASDVNITATVTFASDLNPDNDKAETVISIKEPTVPVVANISAWANDDRVIAYWTAPSGEAGSLEEVTEDVEAYEEFDTGGLTEDNLDEHYGNIGEWTVYDGNREFGYGFNGITVPHLGEPNAWMVMNPASSQVSQDLSGSHPAHSGSQYFISTCVAESEPIVDTDHWLISPELPGVAQTISFYACTITADYGAEEFEILASSTDTNVESFTLIASETTDVTEWKEFTYDLPEGTKYFAIRHVSNDIFGLKVDDIAYSVGSAGVPEIAYFNIYLDGEFAVKASANQMIATIENVENGTHTVAVSVVYTNGQESKPVETTVTVSAATGLNQINVLTQPVDVYSLDGKLVRKQTTSFDGLKGVYVVDGKKVILK